MALRTLVRRASASLQTLTLRAVGSDAVKIVERSNNANPNFLHWWRVSAILHLCTASTSPILKKKKRKQSSELVLVFEYNSNLIRILNSEIKCALDSDLLDIAVDIPDGFPFTFEDNAGEGIIVLKREFEGEAIQVQVDMPSGAGYKIGGNENDAEVEPSIPLFVTVTKANGLSLQFDATALPDRILVNSLSFYELGNSVDDDGIAYAGPNFLKLNGNLRKALHKYLETRGLTASTANFLLEYMISKDSKEYLLWLRSLKKFVQEH